jgi:hypothetical protein
MTGGNDFRALGMSVDIISNSGETIGFSNAGWRYMTGFAESHGWRPADPDAEVLSADEMSALADAIERGLSNKSAADIGAELTQIFVTPPAPSSSLFRSDPIRVEERTLTYWRNFAQFARSGGASVDY